MTSDQVTLFGRIALSAIFIISGIRKIITFGVFVPVLANKGFPAAEIMAVLTIILELGCGILVLAGFKFRWGLIGLAFFTALASVLFHNFWSMEGAAQWAQAVNFLKNLGMIGGLALLYVMGPGRYSLDAKTG
jgi:putative oxidoreductase